MRFTVVAAVFAASLAAAHDCFNCVTGHCLHFGACNNYTGLCECPTGFGGANCSQPVCGSLSEGNQRPLRKVNSSCICEDGWNGINCDMCTRDDACEPFMPSLGLNDARCYTGGQLVDRNFHMCRVTNRKLLDILKGRRAEVTFGCDAVPATCDLQLWIDEIESFFCKFANCEFDGQQYNCADIHCECQPGELLCGQEGSLDISEWLENSVKGPGNLDCDDAGKCTFQEPEMNKLIQYVFGDHSIELQCNASECLHYSQIPGYTGPQNPGGSVIETVLSVGLALLILLGLAAAFNYWGRGERRGSGRNKSVSLNALASEEPVVSAAPVGVYFDQIRYCTQSGKEILNRASGTAPPGSVLAIMGGSGAGKTTLLDILAAKHKTGRLEGVVRLNDTALTTDSPLRQLVGFVDQNDDTLVPTQTVFEHVLFSALLRLPQSMSRASKELRVLDTLNELGIDHIRDRLIGGGLSGGERRRVAIACELVTSPSVLLLDEPTSGLDAFNAFSVVENLVRLAKNSNRTVIFTIHQPRSNIVSLFDRILLLAQGKLIFTGTLRSAEEFFEGAGHKCPPNYNFADFIVDLSMKASLVPYTGEILAAEAAANSVTVEDVLSEVSGEEESEAEAGDGPVIEDELDFTPQEDTPTVQQNDFSLQTAEVSDANAEVPDADADCPDPQVHTQPFGVDPSRQWQDYAFHRAQISRTAARAMAQSEVSLGPQGLEPLLTAFWHSLQFSELREEIEKSTEILITSHYVKRASPWEQFKIISLRIFRNLHRDPMLVLTHYGISAALGVLCGYLYFHVSNDISGFQNRLGLFFFLLAMFGFSTLTTVSLFMRERLMFMRERANGYYHPAAYYCAKVLLDIVPLRLGPPLLLGLILYPLVGLHTSDGAPVVFLLVLALFNLSAASLMLVIGILFADFGVASLLGCMLNLFGILFAGLFLNQDSMPIGSKWVKWLSVYHYAYEALSVNEVKYLTLIEDKFGLKIEVPGATILSAFGFDNSSVVRDVVGLACAAVLSVIIGYICLNKVLIERR